MDTIGPASRRRMKRGARAIYDRLPTSLQQRVRAGRAVAIGSERLSLQRLGSRALSSRHLGPVAFVVGARLAPDSPVFQYQRALRDTTITDEQRVELLTAVLERDPDMTPARILLLHLRRGHGDVKGALALIIDGALRTTETTALRRYATEMATTLGEPVVPEEQPFDTARRLGLEHMFDERLDAAVDELDDPAIAARWALNMVRRGRTAEVAPTLMGRGSPIVPSPVLLRVVDDLHQQGHIRLPLELLESYTARVSSQRLKVFAGRRRRDMELLEEGVDVRIPSLRVSTDRSGVSALYLLHNSLPHSSGGYATRTHGLLTGLARQGHRVVGVTRPGFPAERGTFDQRANVAPADVVDAIEYRRLIGPVESLPRTDLDGFVARYAELLEPTIEELQPAVIHAASNWWNGHAATAIARSLGIPSIYEVRGLWEVTRASREPGWQNSDVYRLDARYESDAARAADHVIVITNGLREEMIRRGVDDSKISIVPNAVDVERFAPTGRDAELAAALDLEGARVIGFVGSMTFYEGLDDLLTVAAELSGATAEPFRLLFVGDGPIRPDLEAQASALGIADLCRFVGRVPHSEVERYLSLIDITPFPRKPLPVCEMVSPLKPLESMASRIAVLVSDVEALDEMVGRGRHGVTFRKGDLTSFAHQLGRLIDDVDMCAELVDSAEEFVRTERNWSTVSGTIAEIYGALREG